MTRAAHGQPHHIICISRDITWEKRNDAEARRQNALIAQQGRLVLLGEMASSLAHIAVDTSAYVSSAVDALY